MSQIPTTNILFVGDVTLDLTMVIDHVPGADEKVHATRSVEAVGGVVANAAVAASASGANVRLGVQVGDDPASEVVLRQLAARGLVVEAARCPGPLSRVVVLLEPHGEKRLVLDPGVSLCPNAEAVAALSLDGITHVHTALYGSAARELIERCRSAGIGWSLDLEPASFPHGITSIASVIDGAAVLFLNERASARIGPDAEQRLLDLGACRVISTLGSAGARYRDASHRFAYRPPPSLPVVDTTGAGDCLAGWFLAGLTQGLPLENSLARAVTAASLSCGSLGAQSSYPDLPTVQSYLSKAAIAS
ncbi:carbohydrate kinase family protein [Aureimonas sp. ME7]|uniref:carbohydrate kinase family protein n=1 Tax=Aureimonas sp. ME7 TaxID=2744252 RepID=UPI0015FDA1A2|nr:carbohydrate kinase family protein [Aureimonas sp. ME7]